MDRTESDSAMEMGNFVNTSVEIEGTASTDWEDKAARVTSDPCTNATLKRALADSSNYDVEFVEQPPEV